MKLDKQRVLDTYNQLPDILKSLVSSERNRTFNSSIIDQYQITDEKAYLSLTTAVMLNLMPFGELKQRLIDESVVFPMEADACVREIKNYIQPLLDYWAAGKKEQESEHIQPEPDTPRSVQPIRTMEGDLKRVHGYGSFGELYGDGSEEPVYKTEQDTVVKKPNLATTPTYRPQPSGQETDQNNT